MGLAGAEGNCVSGASRIMARQLPVSGGPRGLVGKAFRGGGRQGLHGSHRRGSCEGPLWRHPQRRSVRGDREGHQRIRVRDQEVLPVAADME
eukprot:12455044-Alexandrium_andersonii.AAC.1